MKWIVVIAVIITLYGYFHYIFDPFNRFTSTFVERIYNFVGYPNAYANFILAVIPIPFYFLYKDVKPSVRRALYVSLILIISAFFLTYSRGAFIALSVISIPYILGILFSSKGHLKQGIKKLKTIVLLVVLSAILTIPVNYLRSMNNSEVASFADKITLESGEKDTSTSDRLEFWEGSIEMFMDNPVFGTGPGSFQYVFPAYQKTLLANSNSPHNLFLKLLVENGVFAMAFFVLFMLILFLRGIMVYKNFTKNERLLIFTLAASIIGSLLHNMVDYNLNFVSIILLLFIFFGVIGFIINKNSDKFVTELKVRFVKYLLVLVGLLMCFVALHEVYYSYVFIQARAAHKAGDYTAAESYYTKAKDIFLKRDLFIGFAQMNVKKFETEGDIKYLENAEKLLLTGFSLNSHDAFIVNYLGDIAFDMNKIEQAKNYYAQSLKLDPKNNLDYYYDNLNVDDALTKEEIDDLIALLDDYHDKLAQNAHLTILTGNPDSAVMIYELLLSKIKDTEFAFVYNDKLLEGLKQMQDTYELEKSKFEKHYNLKLTKED
ncbi:O-antigen ligase family protein [Candidatus Peregrinibacteria bacterium]|nr:O-antigen ligase family protein [Candidatus Peregrinibacteria bacterium]